MQLFHVPFFKKKERKEREEDIRLFMIRKIYYKEQKSQHILIISIR